MSLFLCRSLCHYLHMCNVYSWLQVIMSLSRHAPAISRRVLLCILRGQGLTIITMITIITFITMHMTPACVMSHDNWRGESSASLMGESWKKSLNTTNTIPRLKYKFSEKTGANWQISPLSRSVFDEANENLILLAQGPKKTRIWSYCYVMWWEYFLF